ncbi:MAG: tetratricopeptide repeat protein [Gammaproteobacteria bacterium]|nr:tetratricopeptide repeat protein [Gammaproteobacteria bacterium]
MKAKNLFPGAVAAMTATLWLGAAVADPAADYEVGAKAYREDDVVTAMQHLGRAASAGHADAQYLLGYILDKAGQNQDAMVHYQSAFDNGNSEAAVELGTMYLLGDGVDKDLETGRGWFEKAAAAGNNRALVVLGKAYLDGDLGVTPDAARARELLGRAADNGSETAGTLLESLDNPAEKPPAEEKE